MAKTNTLKLVPFGTRSRPVGEFGDADFQWRDVTRLLEYTWVKPGEEHHGVEWRPNEPFEATLHLDRLERGRSAARFWFVDEAGTEYPFFGQGLVDMLKHADISRGVVSGTWIAVKRGSNYGIELFEVEP